MEGWGVIQLYRFSPIVAIPFFKFVMGRIWRAECTLAKQAAPCLYLFIFGNI